MPSCRFGSDSTASVHKPDFAGPVAGTTRTPRVLSVLRVSLALGVRTCAGFSIVPSQSVNTTSGGAFSAVHCKEQAAKSSIQETLQIADLDRATCTAVEESLIPRDTGLCLNFKKL